MAGLLLILLCGVSSQAVYVSDTTQSDAFLPTLTEEERVWLRENPVIRVVMSPDWSPVEFADEVGNPTGISEEYLQQIERLLGVTFERLRNLSWHEAYTRLQYGEADMASCLAQTPSRSAFLAFTTPYMQIPIVIVTDHRVPYIGSMHELAGKSVAVSAGYAVYEWITRDYPAIELTPVASPVEGLKAVQRGDAFAYVDAMLVVGHYLTLPALTTLKIAGQTPYMNAQTMAVRQELAPLAAILDKALDAIPESEKSAIYNRWVPVFYEHGPDYSRIWLIVALFTVAFVFVVVWLCKLLREITRRKHAETSLRVSEERFRQMALQSRTFIWELDVHGVYTFVDPVAAAIIGYHPEELVGKKRYVDLAPPEDRDEAEAFGKAFSETGENMYGYENRMVTKDGRVLWVVSTFIALRDKKGVMIGARGVDRDITEKKQADTALRESEERYRSIIELLNDAVCRWAPDTTLTFANMHYRKLFGIPPHAPLGMSWHTLVPHEEDDTVREFYAELVAHPRQVRYEHKVILSDGSIHWFDWADSPLYDAEGKLKEFQSVGRDVTERKADEEKMAAQLHELQRWHDVMLYREDRILTLKKEVNALLSAAGQPQRYSSAAGDAQEEHT